MNNLSTLSLYRLLIKNAKFYPSKNRDQIELAIREGKIKYIREFRVNQ